MIPALSIGAKSPFSGGWLTFPDAVLCALRITPIPALHKLGQGNSDIHVRKKQIGRTWQSLDH
jgi:hypothetical protein